jgi:DNA-binding NarL/FixJ family response regulator
LVPWVSLASIPNPDARVKVLVADAVAMSCRLLAEALQRTKRFEATAAVSAEEVVSALLATPYHIVLLSVTAPDDALGGVTFLRQIQEAAPKANVVVLLDNLERNQVVEAFRCGASGVFWRADSFQTLCKCIQCVHQGQVWASSAELHFLLDAVSGPSSVDGRSFTSGRPLSKREEEIARLVTEGMSNRQISQQLDLSEHTIKNYLFRIFEKLGVSTRVELALFALKGGTRRGSDARPGRPSLRASSMES